MGLLYFAKKFFSSRVGVDIKEVKCAQCGCEYSYELARVGNGTGSAPYWIGQRGASERAEKRAERDLERRLAEEAELVPCPRCHWINDELVEGYRRGSYEILGTLAVVVAVGGTTAFWFATWVISAGPGADRTWLPFCAYGGPAICVVTGAALFVLRNWLRNLIQPNRNFPQPPKLPPGTPTARIFNEATGNMQNQWPEEPPAREPSGWYRFRIGCDQFPTVCCECLGRPSEKHSMKYSVGVGIPFEIPRCAHCEKRGRRKFWKAWVVSYLCLFGTGAGVMVAVGLEDLPLTIWLGGYAIMAMVVATAIGEFVSEPVRLFGGTRPRGEIELTFRNPKYLQLLRDQGKQ